MLKKSGFLPRTAWLPCIVLCVGIGLALSLVHGAVSSQAASTAPAASAPPASAAPHSPGITLTLIPADMSFAGDVSSQANCTHPTVCEWLSSVPSSSVILGADPASADTGDWDGGLLSAQVHLPAIYSPTLYVLKIAWPDQDGKGLHSPEKRRYAAIRLDGGPVWDKRTEQIGDFGDYYAAQHDPILTTQVISQPLTVTLSISVEAHTVWDISRIDLLAYPFPEHIRGIGYSPYRKCQGPNSTEQPSSANIQEDLQRLYHTSNAIRTYSATGVNQQIAALANAQGIPVYAGAWMDKLPADEAEIQALIDLAHTSHLAGAIVGNEYYLRHRSVEDIETLRQRIVQVKAEIPAGIPVMSAEIDNLIFDWPGASSDTPIRINELYRPIVDEVDIVLVHIYPYWNGQQILGAAEHAAQRYKAMQALLEQEYPGQNKRLVIGETGWPAGGFAKNPAIPGRQNQKKYMQEFLVLAEQHQIDYFYFDAFDELWKIEEPGFVGQNWGYSFIDRSARHDFYGVLLPGEALPSLPVLSEIYLPLVKRQEGTTQKAGLTDFTTMNGLADRFYLYHEWAAPPGGFMPSGWQGDIEQMGMDGCDLSDPQDGEIALRAWFEPEGELGWAGAAWQYPENNWGNLAAGIDLSWANKLTFWARGQEGGERIRFFAGGIGTQNDPYPDSLRPEVSSGFIELGTQWMSYTLDLRGKDLSHTIGGFGWATTRCANPTGAVFYLDEVYYAYDPNLPPPPEPGPLFILYTDAAMQHNHYTPSLWLGDGETAGHMALDECWHEAPYSGQEAIRIDYTPGALGWGGVYWVEPANNLGDRPGGFDLRGVRRLSFWARSAAPNTQVKFLLGGVGYRVDDVGHAICSKPLFNYPDSLCPGIQQTETLGAAWQRYEIDLSSLTGDFSHVVGGFGVVLTSSGTIYLDDILYEYE